MPKVKAVCAIVTNTKGEIFIWTGDNNTFINNVINGSVENAITIDWQSSGGGNAETLDNKFIKI